MKYISSDDTLFHSCGMNIQRLDSIFKTGIFSVDYFNDNNIGINYTRNYHKADTNTGYISCCASKLVNPDDIHGSYCSHIEKGFSFIIEDVPYIDRDNNKDNIFIHRSDEVLVKDYISKDHFKGIMVPLEYQELSTEFVKPIPSDIKDYHTIAKISDDYFSFLNNDALCLYKVILKKDYEKLQYIARLAKNCSEDSYLYYERMFSLVISNMNRTLGIVTEYCYKKNVSNIKELVQYITDDSYPIYELPYERKR